LLPIIFNHSGACADHRLQPADRDRCLIAIPLLPIENTARSSAPPTVTVNSRYNGADAVSVEKVFPPCGWAANQSGWKNMDFITSSSVRRWQQRDHRVVR